MTEEYLFKQLNRLKNIKPDADYSNASRLIITANGEKSHEKISPMLHRLKAISPSPEFLAISKPAILSHPRTLAEKARQIFMPYIGKRAMSYGISLGFVAILFAITISGVNSIKINPEIDIELAYAAETSIKDIDIRLEEASYFASSADITKMALKDAAGVNLSKNANPSAENEFNGLKHDNPLNPDINDMLMDAIL